jgi:hypothetical protein
MARGKDNSAFSPDIRVQDEWHSGSSDALKHALKAAVMISVTVREDDGSEVCCSHFEHVHVMKYGSASQTCIVKN